MASWLLSLGTRPLSKTDEGRYAEISREMVLNGDWITPRLNDLKYFEKPPLQYWATAVAFKTFGFHEWAARLWTGLCGLFSILTTGWAAYRLYGRRIGWISAGILGTSLSFYMMGHVNALDMGFTGMLTGALATVIGARTSRQHASRWMLACWAFLALAVLSKGLAGLVLPGGVLVIYTLLSRDWAMFKAAQWIKGPLVFLLISAPWFIAVSIKNPEFAEFFFIHEHLDRFTTDEHKRTGPIWYFLPQLLLGLFPWTGLFFLSFWKTRSSTNEIVPSHEGFKPTLLLIVWAAFIFAFFSISKSKLPSYIVPIFPAIAILCAITLDRLTTKQSRYLFIVSGLICLLGSLVIAFFILHNNIPTATQPFAWIIAAGALLIGLVSCWGGQRLSEQQPNTNASVIALVLITSLFHFALGVGYSTMSRSVSTIDLAREVGPLIGSNDPIYSVQTYEQSLPFYLQRTVILVNYIDEFRLGLDQEAEKGIEDMDTFIDRWNKHEQAWAFMRIGTFEHLKAEHVPMTLQYNQGSHILVSKQ